MYGEEEDDTVSDLESESLDAFEPKYNQPVNNEVTLLGS